MSYDLSTSEPYTFCASIDCSKLDDLQVKNRMAFNLSALKEYYRPVRECGETMRIEPEDVKVGDLMHYHGFVGRVEKIRSWEGSYARGNAERTCFGFALSYVEGDLDKYKYFVSTICNGCVKGDLAYAQGNNLCSWYIEK